MNEERKLAEYLEISAPLHCGLTKSETKNLAYIFAVKNNKNVKNWVKLEEANEERLRSVFKCNSDIIFKKT